MASLSDLVTSIRIDTAWGPPIVLDDPFGPQIEPNPFLEAMQPKITVGLRALDPVEIAPYGEPGPTKWPLVKGSLLLLGIGATWVVLRAVRPPRR